MNVKIFLAIFGALWCLGTLSFLVKPDNYGNRGIFNRISYTQGDSVKEMPAWIMLLGILPIGLTALGLSIAGMDKAPFIVIPSVWAFVVLYNAEKLERLADWLGRQ